MKQTYKFKAKVWPWGDVGSWWFVNVPEKICKEIRSKYPKGMVRINVSLGKSKYDSALFPNKNSKGEFGYLLSIRKKVRQKEEILENDTITVSFVIV